MSQPNEVVPTAEQPSVAARLEARAQALAPRRFLAPANAVRRCSHVTELGEAPERVKRWVTIREQIGAEIIKAGGETHAWMIRQQSILEADRKEASAKLVMDADRRAKRMVALERDHMIAKLICDQELAQSFPDVEVEPDLVVDSDWTVLAIDHTMPALLMGLGAALAARFDDMSDDDREGLNRQFMRDVHGH